MVMATGRPGPSWQESAKYRSQLLGRVNYDLGLNVPQRIQLRNAGYLERLHLFHQLGGTFSAAPSASDVMGQYCGAINRVTLRMNSIGDVWDTSGFMAAVFSALNNQYRYGAGSMTPTPPYAHAAAPGVAAFVNGYAFDLPIALYLANKPYPFGLVQLALNSMEATLELRFNPAGTANQAGLAQPVPGTTVYGYVPGTFTNGTSYVDVTQDYFDPIPDESAQPPLGYLHRVREFQQAVSADGDVEIRLPAGSIYTRVVLAYVQGAANALTLNGWASPASPGVITRVQMKYGGNLAPFDWNAATIQHRMQRQYSMTLPTGVYVLDLLEDTHTERDIIDSQQTTDLRMLVTTASGAYAGGAYIKVGVEELVPLTATRGPQG